VESWRSAGGYRVRPDGSEGFWLTIYDVPAETDMITPIMVEGRWLRPDDGNAIVINTGYLEQEPDIRVGDDLVLRLKGRDRPFRVVGIAQALLVGPLAYTNQPYLATTINEPRTVDRVLIETREDTPAYRAAIAEEVGMHMRRAGMIGASTFTFDTAISQIQYQFNILLVVLLIMVALLTLVGGLGLTGTVAINVLERTRELGVMRVCWSARASWASCAPLARRGLPSGASSWPRP
jgi:putative ABC transport system permease protein